MISPYEILPFIVKMERWWDATKNWVKNYGDSFFPKLGPLYIIEPEHQNKGFVWNVVLIVKNHSYLFWSLSLRNVRPWRQVFRVTNIKPYHLLKLSLSPFNGRSYYKVNDDSWIRIHRRSLQFYSEALLLIDVSGIGWQWIGYRYVLFS